MNDTHFVFVTDWNSDKETILLELAPELNRIFKGTKYSFVRNENSGERDVDVKISGVTDRVGSIWPHNNKMIYDVVLNKDIAEEMKFYWDDTKYQQDSTPKNITFKNLHDDEFFELIIALLKTR